MSEASNPLDDDSRLRAQISEATTRMASAEGELTLAMEALNLPDHDADNEVVGERMSLALEELRRARAALEFVLEGSS